MRIAHVFKMANDGWSVVKGLRSLGIDAHLIFHRPAHVASFPQWEEAEIDLKRLGDPYDPDWDVLNEHWPMPNYTHLWNMREPWYAAGDLYLISWLMKRYAAYLYRPQPLRKIQPISRKLLKPWTKSMRESMREN